MVGKALSEVRQFQGKAYAAAVEHSATALFFAGLSPPPDEEIFADSLRVEPRVKQARGTPHHTSLSNAGATKTLLTQTQTSESEYNIWNYATHTCVKYMVIVAIW